METNVFTKQLQKMMHQKIDSLEETPVNIAITGDSGTGKSTIVNTLRGLRHDDPAAASVGTVETTMQPTPYKHPNFPNVTFWDLPGVGTPKNPRSTYKKRMNLKSYDFFIITISSRFTENSLWLAQQLNKMRKSYFFVRSKLDLDIEMKRKRDPNITDQQVINELRNDIRSHANGLPISSEIFLLSGELENSDRWDFALLKKRIIEVLPDVKRNALIVSLGGYAGDLIDAKYEVLKHRLIYYSLGSALGAVVPIPGFSFGVDTSLIIKMAREYAKAFGLTSSQVRQSYVRIASRAKVATILGNASAMWTTQTIVKILTTQASSGVAEEALNFIPLLGQGAAATLSFISTYHCGRIILKKMRKLAKDMAHEIIQYEAEAGLENNENIPDIGKEEKEEDILDKYLDEETRKELEEKAKKELLDENVKDTNLNEKTKEENIQKINTAVPEK